MKTDRFSDMIRRKLESIRPEFSEKDWTRMQASLQTGIPQPATPPGGNPFSGGIWSAKPWLMAAATVSSVVLVAFSYYQYREIGHLRQTISQLHKQATHQAKPAKPADTTAQTNELSPAPSGPSDEPVADKGKAQPVAEPKTLHQRDTVYITRYVPVPAKSHVVPPEENRLAERSETVPDRYATHQRTPNATAQPNQSDNSVNIPKTDTYGEPSTPSNTVSENESVLTNNSINSAVTSTKSVNRATREPRINTGSTVANQTKKGRRSTSSNYVDVQTGRSGTPSVDGRADQPVAAGQPVPSDGAATSAIYEPLQNAPMSTPTANWNVLLAQRARRMRPARTTVVGGVESVKAPESQPVVQISGRFRVGIGGEIAPKLLSAGVFGEVILGKHWTIGAGISQATYSGEKFVNDFDFNERTRRNFRKEFARSIDPRRDIFNIDTRTVRLQIPLALGYRVPLNRSLTFTPTVGTYLNLTSSENATYYCPVLIPPASIKYEEISTSDTHEPALLNTWTLGAGLEWQGGHWVIQGSPVLTMPIQSTMVSPDMNWQRSTTVGLRARLLYQF